MLFLTSWVQGRTLLILGEPGAGKTTTLLELTRDLLNRAEQGLDYRIPIVLKPLILGCKAADYRRLDSRATQQ